MQQAPPRSQSRETVAVVIPAYREEKHIADVVTRARKELKNVLVVDDGSADETADRARAMGAEVIRHPENKGKGETIKTGLRYWLEKGMNWVFILDADGQHRPEEIDNFMQAALVDGATLLIGNRMNDTSRMPLIRRFVNRYMSNRISKVCGQQIPDTQCGYRLINRALIPDILVGTGRFDYETEMLILASQRGHRIESVAISTVYSDEVSSIHPVRDTIRFFKLMKRYGG